MTRNGSQSAHQVVGVVSEILEREPHAAEFALKIIPAGVRYVEDVQTWAVPLASGNPGGSSYDLMKVIEHIQELAEQRINSDISVYLDPFAA
jgi:hypothetical protein